MSHRRDTSSRIRLGFAASYRLPIDDDTHTTPLTVELVLVPRILPGENEILVGERHLATRWAFGFQHETPPGARLPGTHVLILRAHEQREAHDDLTPHHHGRCYASKFSSLLWADEVQFHPDLRQEDSPPAQSRRPESSTRVYHHLLSLCGLLFRDENL